MVDNDLVPTRTYGPETVKVSTDGGWLLAAKESNSRIVAQLAREQEENRYENAVRDAKEFAGKIQKVLGVDVEVSPGTEKVIIDGLHFTNPNHRYMLRYWQQCSQCGEPAMDYDFYNKEDLASFIENNVNRACDSCERKKWVANHTDFTPAVHLPTPLETLGAALVAYFKSEIGTEAGE